MLLRLFICLCVLNATTGWMIEVTPKDFKISRSKNVTIECHNNYKDLDTPAIVNVDRISMMKKVKNVWTTVAEMRVGNTKGRTVFGQKSKVTGHVDGPDDSFMRIHFEIATEDTTGLFRCKVDGLDSKGNLKGIKSTPFWVEEDSKSFYYEDIMKMINAVKKQEKDHQSDNIKKIKKLSNDIANLVNTDTDKTIEGMHRFDPSAAWPVGTYALLRPDSGCPDSIINSWQFSSVKITTQPGKRAGSKSSILNLSGKVIQHIDPRSNYVNLEMCSKTNERGPVWPKGSYCVQVYSWDGSKCPAGLHYGYISYGRYANGKLDEIVNLPNFYGKTTGPKRTDIPYCCRKDGKATQPMVLPYEKPFYLYRHGGRCQEVQGMKVTNQWIKIDTNNNHGYNRGWFNFPDSTINNHGAIIEICYYTPL